MLERHPSPSYYSGMKKLLKTSAIIQLALILCFPAGAFALNPAPIPSETPAEITEEEDPDESSPDTPSALTRPTLRAVNPGYTVSSVQNHDDLIEIYNPTGEPLSLKNTAIVYNENFVKPLHSFAAEDYMNAEFLTLRYKSSPNAALADVNYSTNMSSSAARVTLVQFSEESPEEYEILDDLCWGTDKDLLEKFPTCENKYSHFGLVATKETTLVRCLVDGLPEKCSNGKDFEYISGYVPYFDPENPALIQVFGGTILDDLLDVGHGSEDALPKCLDLRFSEILTYYVDAQTEQFVEFFNTSSEIVDLSGCSISYKNKSYPLSGVVPENGYFAFRSETLKLTKNPTSSNVISLVDVNDAVVDTLEYLHGQKKSVALAVFGVDENGEEIWKQTYAQTPGEENIYQEFRSCPSGKIINPSTGNCINFVEQVALPDCGEGRYRHPETNRCRNIISASTEPVPCKDGYERNPETNRCRKIRENSGTDYALEPLTFSEKSSFMAYGTLSAVITTGVLYIIFQFRSEIAGFFKKLFRPKQRAIS
jgi:hypothetical protein